MAIVLMEGYEALPQLPAGIVGNFGATTYSSTTGRTGGLAPIGNNENHHLNIVIAPASDTIYWHQGLWSQGGVFGNTQPSLAPWHLYTDNAGTCHLSCTFEASTGKLQLRRGAAGPVIATSAKQVGPAAQWNSMQVKATIHDTTGECVIKLNGEVWINYTGDTRNGGTLTRPDRLALPAGAGYCLHDDVLVVDTTTANDNSWPGEIIILAIKPSGNGAHSDLVGSDGNSTDNYALVDDLPTNSADYVGSVTALAKDTYDMTQITKVGNVVAVRQTSVVSKSDAGTKFGKSIVRSAAGAFTKGADIGLSTSPAPSSEPISKTDPDGNPWTVARVNAAEFGFEVQ